MRLLFGYFALTLTPSCLTPLGTAAVVMAAIYRHPLYSTLACGEGKGGAHGEERERHVRVREHRPDLFDWAKSTRISTGVPGWVETTPQKG